VTEITVACRLPPRRLLAGALLLLVAACQTTTTTNLAQNVSPKEPQTAETLMRVADDTRAGGDLASAASLYQRVHEMEPKDPAPLGKLAGIMVQMKAYNEAADTYRSAIELAPDDTELHRGLAIALLSLERSDAAIAELQTALAKSPDDARLLNTMGVAHDLVGRHDLAQLDYRKALKTAPKSAGLRNNYGLSLALSGEYGAAVSVLTEIGGDRSSPPRYRLNLALVYGLSGDDQRATQIARTALDEESVRSNIAYYAMLRSMDEKSRSAAIMGRQLRGAPVGDTPSLAEKSDKVDTSVAVAPLDPATATPIPAASNETSMAVAAPVAEPSHSAEGAAEPTKLAAAAPAPAKPHHPASRMTKPAMAEPKAAPATTDMDDMAPAPKATKAASGFVLQLGAFAQEANARKLVDQLNRKGYEVAVVHNHDQKGRDWYIVRAGGYATADEAAAAARHMREAEQVPAVVVHLHEPSHV
jgi:Flp pilus assembly protein TadD